MKKTIITSMLGIMSLSISLSASAGYYSNSNERESKIDLSYASYDFEYNDTEILDDESGVLLGYQYNGSDNDLMLRGTVEGFKLLDETFLFAQAGIGYDLPLNLNRVILTPEAGIYYSDHDNESDSGAYFGGSVTVEIIPGQLIGTAYYRNADFDNLTEDYIGSDFMGVKLSYEFDLDVTLDVGYEKLGNLDRLSIGLGHKF